MAAHARARAPRAPPARRAVPRALHPVRRVARGDALHRLPHAARYLPRVRLLRPRDGHVRVTRRALAAAAQHGHPSGAARLEIRAGRHAERARGYGVAEVGVLRRARRGRVCPVRGSGADGHCGSRQGRARGFYCWE